MAGQDVSWTTRNDLAETAAIALAEEGRLDGITAPLTAFEAVDLDGVAAVLSDVIDRTVTRVVIDDEDYKSAMMGRGAPAGRPNSHSACSGPPATANSTSPIRRWRRSPAGRPRRSVPCWKASSRPGSPKCSQ